jgi:hypothetical protein
MQTPRTALLIRPKHILGESLSSWRQRIAWANCYKLFPVADERTRRADPDMGANENELHFVTQLHQSTKDIVVGMTLKGLEGRLARPLKTRSHPAWWLSAGYGLLDREHGSMYCPQCLAEDDIPHFRLNWRLGFITDCRFHKVRMLDHCQNCRQPPWPAGCGSKGRVHRSFTSFRYCWHCGSDYGKFGAVKTTIIKDIECWLDDDTTLLGSEQVKSADAFVALRTVCRLFLRGFGRSTISKSESCWSEVLQQLSAETASQHLERISVDDRSILLSTGYKILERWPSSFTKFAKETGISKWHFDGMNETLPDWFSKVVDADIAIKKTTVTDAVLVNKVEELTNELGRKPNKTELRKALNWQGERGMENIYPKRLNATEDEWQQFVFAIRQLDMKVLNTRERRALLSNLTVLLVCLIENIDIYKINVSTKQEWVERLIIAPIHAGIHEELFCNLIELLRPKLEELLKPKVVWLMQSQINRRAISVRLRSLMTGLPDELARDVNVFRNISM